MPDGYQIFTVMAMSIFVEKASPTRGLFVSINSPLILPLAGLRPQQTGQGCALKGEVLGTGSRANIEYHKRGRYARPRK